jgi:hypothetical protein
MLQATELAPRKANLIGTFSRSLETTGALVSRVADLALYGLPLGESNRYTASIQSVISEGRAVLRRRAPRRRGERDHRRRREEVFRRAEEALAGYGGDPDRLARSGSPALRK